MKMTTIFHAAVGLALLAVGAIATHQSIELTKAESALTLYQSTITNLKLEIGGLQSEVKHLNGEVESVLSQAELVAQLNTDHEQQNRLIASTGNDWITNSNKLQVSQHEPTRSWSATYLPDDALRMLHDASRSQNSYRDKVSHSAASGKFFTLGLSSTAI